MAAEVDELLVEEPCELELQRGVVGNLTGKNDALADRHVQCVGSSCNDRWLWKTIYINGYT